jgi:hypothetical protein
MHPPLGVHDEVVVDELAAATVNGECGLRDCHRDRNAREHRQDRADPGAQKSLAIGQRPEPEARERTRQNEERLLRAHDRGAQAEPAAEKPAEGSPRRDLRLKQPAQ